MPSCCAVDCAYNHYRTKTLGKSIHRFPFSQPEVMQKWIINICRKDFWPKKNSVLCSSHFEEACFDRTGQTIRLRKDAVPTIFSHKPLIKYERGANIYPSISRHKVPNPPPVIVKLPAIEQDTIEDIESESDEDTELSCGDIDLRDHNYDMSPLKLKTKYKEEKEKNDHLKAKFKRMQQDSMQLQNRASMLLNLLRDLKSA